MAQGKPGRENENMENQMKKLALALLLGAFALPSATLAQQHDDRRAQQDRPGKDRPSATRPGQARPGQAGQHQGGQQQGGKALGTRRPPQQSGNRRNYDYNRLEPGQKRYYADRYYRDGANYTPFRVTRQTRIYRGSNGRYYCRRSDGTTGTIVGVAIGAVLGNRLANGDSRLLATILGAGAGGALGREIDRGNVRCR